MKRLKYLPGLIWRGFKQWPLERRIVVIVCLLAGCWCAEFLLDTTDSWRTRLTERLAEGKNPTAKHHFQTGMWYGTLVSCIVFFGAALTAKWWLVRLPVGWANNSLERFGSRFWIMVLLAIVLAGCLRWPRMSQSVYVDEEYTLRANAHGQFAENAVGKPEFIAVEWGHELWENKIGNNHFLYSVVGRVSLDVWRWLGGQPRAAFDETAFRLPSLLGGLAAIVVIALLVGRLGFPDAGWIAAWLLALHPWHVRYSAEGRGYALMILCLLGALYCLVNALQRGNWHWWVSFGCLQFLMMGFYGGSLYVAAAINLSVFIYLLVRGLRERRQFPVLVVAVRWLVANVLTATLLLQTMFPWMLEIRRYLGENPRAFGVMDAGWYAEVWAYLLTGMQWLSDAPANPIIVTVSGQFGSMALVIMIGLSLLSLLGLIRLMMAGGVQFVVVASFLFAVILALGHSLIGGRYLFTWYLLFFTPAAVVGMAVAVIWLSNWFPGQRSIMRLIAGGLAIVLFAFFISDQAATISLNPKEDFRRVVTFMRGEVDVEGAIKPEELTAFSFSEGGFYDPWAFTIWDAGDVEDLMAKADAQQRELIISYGHRQLSLERRSEIMKLLDDPQLFRETGVFPGLEERQFTHYVLQYIRRK